jgi:formate dehydrogenase subunit delta
MSPDKLAYMANQIGRFFATQRHQNTADSVADHLLKFWDPRMREAIIAKVDDESLQLDPPVREAVRMLRDRQTA